MCIQLCVDVACIVQWLCSSSLGVPGHSCAERVLMLHIFAAGEHIDVKCVTKLEENKQARDKHVLGLLTALRAVFPGNVKCYRADWKGDFPFCKV